MALAKTLDIHQTAFRLLKVVADPLVTMPRHARAVFGVPMRDLLRQNLTLIEDANIADSKVPHLDTLLRHLREEEILLRLFHDKRWMGDGQYAQAIQLSVSVARQANGWRKKYA